MRSVEYLDRLVDLKAPKGSVLFFDKRLLNRGMKEARVQSWVKSFEFFVPLAAGEKLKSLKEFERAVAKLQSFKSKTSAPLSLWSMGGGTVGDFCGFVASVFHRGVPWVNVPTTWLSAIDSAHGGKTALNIGAKNQVGTYYVPTRIVMVKDILFCQPLRLRQDAWVEAFKVSLLEGQSLVNHTLVAQSSDDYWRLLPKWVAAKNRIVAKDPFEKKGIRQFLNLGHTLGHVFESAFELSHGESVALGLRFCLEWSFHLGGEREGRLRELSRVDLLPSEVRYVECLNKLFKKRALLDRLLSLDKKVSAGKIGFVFLKQIGAPMIRWVTKEEIYFELQRQARLLSSSNIRKRRSPIRKASGASQPISGQSGTHQPRKGR